MKRNAYAVTFTLATCLVLLTLSPALAQKDTADNQRPRQVTRGEAETFVRIKLLEAASGKPIANCAVRIFTDDHSRLKDDLSVVTDPAGVVAVPLSIFQSKDDRPVSITVETVEFRTHFWLRWDPSPVEKLPRDPFELYLTRKPTIRIHLVNEATGEALAEREVQVVSTNGVRPLIIDPKILNPKKWSGRTDAEGTFELPSDLIQLNTYIQVGTLNGRIPPSLTEKPEQELTVRLLPQATLKEQK